MANAIVTFKIMPESVETDLDAIKVKAFEIAKLKGAKGEMQGPIEPIAFGLKMLKVMAMYEVCDENDFDGIAQEMEKISGVQSAEVFSMDLAMG